MSSTSYSDAFTFLPQGAIIQEFKVANKNIVLGFPSADSYKLQTPNLSPFFGETIGRVANRISGAKINSLNGKEYRLTANNGPNTLHGGPKGWGKQTFEGPKPVQRQGREAVEFKYISPDGDEGFPGTVEFRCWYFPGVDHDEGVEKTRLEMEYEVELVGDEVEETVVALTNHSYFNLGNGPTIEGTEVVLGTNLHQVVDDDAIPTGEVKEFPGLPPVGTKLVLGEKEPDIDHCFVMNPDPSSVPLDTRKGDLKRAVKLYHPDSQIHFESLSTEPAFQFYLGKFVDVPATQDGAPARRARSGLCIESSRYVNAINNEAYRGMVVLKKGQVWGSRTVWRAWKA